MFDIVATEESIDLTTLRELMIKPILTDVLSVLMSWDIRMVDIDYLNQRLIGALEESERISMSKLWKKAGRVGNNVLLSDVDRVIKNYD